jgi:hypothetical protein
MEQAPEPVQRGFFAALRFALSRAVLLALTSVLLLLALKSFGAYMHLLDSTGTNTDYASGNLFLLLPFFCAAALIMLGGFFIAVVVVTALLNFAVPPFARNPSAVNGVAFVVSLVVIIPAHLGAYFFSLRTVDSALGDVTSYLAYFFFPSLFLLFVAVLTANYIRRAP